MRFIKLPALLLATALPLWVHAALPAAQEKEIDAFLNKVAASPCSFIRNGSSNTGAQAAAHLRRKLDATRDQLGTTTQFIDYVASKSSTSGKPYEVHCPGQPQQLAQAWLHQLRQSK